MLQLKVELQSAPNLNLLAVTSLSIFLIASAGVLWHVGCWLFLQTELSPFVITLPTVILSAYFLYLVLHTWVHLPLETIDEGGLLYRSVR